MYIYMQIYDEESIMVQYIEWGKYYLPPLNLDYKRKFLKYNTMVQTRKKTLRENAL